MSESPEGVIYLDHAATTPTRPEVVEAMAPFMNDRFGNPSGSHVVARSAVNAMDEAREVIAGIIGAEPGDVIFTSVAIGSSHLQRCGTPRGARCG